jgi:DNA replication protein DnaC
MKTDLENQLRSLGLLGLATRLGELGDAPWLETVIDIEREERALRGLDRRVKNARLGRFKPLADYDWAWPEKVDRQAIESAMGLGFIERHENILLVGGIGLGKTMIASNIAHAAIQAGLSVRFTTASAMLGELINQDSSAALKRAFRRYTSPAVLVIDELGYLAYGARHADVLFEVVNQRYELQRPLIITTNRTFKEWGELFPNATCVLPLVDRLVHRCEVIHIEGKSYRFKEAQEAEQARKKRKR